MGTVIGAMHVRRSAFIRATPERVWEEFASFDRMREWFGVGHTLHAYEPKLGAAVELSVELDGTRQHFGGPITLLEPGREVTFACDWHDPSLARDVPMTWTLRLSPMYDGTMVEIFHHGFERFGLAGGDLLDGYEGGWDNKHVRALRAIVEQ
jgi:uncharacterized protein YndB with AHSA1/START domain